jgi:ferritin-like metal-binding protein YciE
MVLFGTVRAYADELNDADLEDLFDECLDEEKKANKRLTKLALTGINEAAAEQPMVHNL